MTGPLDALSEAIESGAGLPAVARAAGAALGGSVALIDRSSAVLAVAAARRRRSRSCSRARGDVETLELRVADAVVGELRYRGSRRRSVADADADGLDPARARARALAGAGVGQRRGRRGSSCARCSAARSPTAATSSPAPASSPRTSTPAAGWSSRAPRRAPRRRATGGRGCWSSRCARCAPRARARSPSSASDGERAEVSAIVPVAEPEQLARAAQALGARARRLAAGLSPHRRPQPLGRRPGRPLPGRPGGAAGRQRRRGRRASSCSRSRTPAPTGCCCRR